MIKNKEVHCDQRTPVGRSDPAWMQGQKDKLCLRELDVIDGRWHCAKHGFCWTVNPMTPISP